MRINNKDLFVFMNTILYVNTCFSDVLTFKANVAFPPSLFRLVIFHL